MSARVKLQDPDAYKNSTDYSREKDALEDLNTGIAIIFKRKDVPIHIHAAMHSLLSMVYLRMNNVNEARRVVKESKILFEGTREEGHILISECQVSLYLGDIDIALNQLRNISRDSPHFLRARMSMADIYLNHRMNKSQYVQCYKDLVEMNPNVNTWCMLGDALLEGVQDADGASKAFIKAFELCKANEKNLSETCPGSDALSEARALAGQLARNIGNTLIAVHDYDHAVDYLKEACRYDITDYQLQF